MKLEYTNELKIWFQNYLYSRIGVEVRVDFSMDYHSLEFKQGDKSFQLLVKSDNNLDSNSRIKYIPGDSIRKIVGTWGNHRLYIHDSGASKLKFAESISGRLQINYDIVFTIISVLNRLEEYEAVSFDVHGRFSLSNSVLEEDGIFRIPIVDYLILFLRKLLIDCGFEISREHFKFSVSCDVDNIHRYKEVNLVRRIPTVIVDLFRRPKLLYKYYIDSTEFAAKYDPHQNFDFMLKLSSEYNFPLTFNFIINNTSLRYDYRYRLKSEFNNLFRLLIINGQNVGLHFSYNALKKGTISKEIQKFARICTDFGTSYNSWRFHYLRFKVPDLFRLSAPGYIDTSVTFAESGGFRCGTCHQFTPFNLADNSEVSFQVSPLIVMEGSLFSYSALTGASFEHEMSHLINECKSVKGNFTLLWHNSDLDERNKILFENTIKQLRL